MKKRKTVIILIIGIIVGLCISGIGTYAVTTYVIKSNDVEYQDNSDLGVTNVQAAIDGTCSKIDTRLGSIESNKQDKLSTTSAPVTILSNFKTTFSVCQKAHKYGNVVSYTCGFDNASEIPAQTPIFQLPEGYRPITGVLFPIIRSGTGLSYNADLGENGRISLTNNKLEANAWYVFSVTFITK